MSRLRQFFNTLLDAGEGFLLAQQISKLHTAAGGKLLTGKGGTERPEDQAVFNLQLCNEVKEGGMDNLFVPMKLTVLNVEDDMSEDDIERYNSITKTISQCANSQNAVSEADFFSNHPFHVLMEQLSRKKMAPPVNGNPYQTIWLYER
jgi:hypothetical protein